MPNAFQKMFVRMLIGAAMLSLLLTLCFLAQQAFALVEMLCVVVISVAEASWAACVAMYAGSAALNGVVLALVVSWTHFRFWGRAKWDGKAFSVDGQPALGKWSATGGAIGFSGFVVLVTSLWAHSDTRSALDSMLCLVALQVVITTLAHKARMIDIAISTPGSDCYCKDGDNTGEYAVLAIGGIAAVVTVGRLIDSSGYELLALSAGMIAYAVVAIGVFKTTRLPGAVGCYA